MLYICRTKSNMKRNLTFKTSREFYDNCISVISALSKSEYQLTFKERMFLIECCLYRNGGGDLSNFAELSKHLVNIKLFKKFSDTSLYKYKLSVKKWIVYDRDEFELPTWLDADKKSLQINLIQE